MSLAGHDRSLAFFELVAGWIIDDCFVARPVQRTTLPLSMEPGTSSLAEAAGTHRCVAHRDRFEPHDELYFKKSAPVISDNAYDQLKRELAALEQAFPEAKGEAGGVEAGVGDDRMGSFATYRHRVRMLSLSKSYTEAELRAFDARLKKQLGRSELDYVVELKFDGARDQRNFRKEESSCVRSRAATAWKAMM